MTDKVCSLSTPDNNACTIFHLQFIVAHVLLFCVICVHIIVMRKLRMYKGCCLKCFNRALKMSTIVVSKLCCVVLMIPAIAGFFQNELRGIVLIKARYLIVVHI